MVSNSFDSLNYYKILEVPYNASDEMIRQKYRELAKFWHPDHNSNPNAVDMFQKISVAYDVLKDAHLRLKYDLLSIIYSSANFPDMNALSLIRNVHGQEDLNLRAFHLIEITGKGIGHSSIDKIYYCSQYEASNVIKSITKHNWIYGFLGITAIFANIKALIQNVIRINNKKDNLLLFLHNSLVYQSEGKLEEAATLAVLATKYAYDTEKIIINKYIETLNQQSLFNLKPWNYTSYKKQQLFYPLILIGVLALIFTWFAFNQYYKYGGQDNGVKKVVVFFDGKKVYSDVAVAKIFDIPVNVSDTTKLYHTTAQTNARHGADDSFDIFKVVEEGTTVRITGYTLDKDWFRVMFDNGEMAFIKAKYLVQGIGKDIPMWSKIYKER